MIGGKIYEGHWEDTSYNKKGSFVGVWKNNKNKSFIIQWDGKWEIFEKEKKIYIGTLHQGLYSKTIKWIGNYNNDGYWDGEYTIILPEYVAELYEYKIENYSDSKIKSNTANDYSFIFNRFRKEEIKCDTKINAISNIPLKNNLKNNDYKKSCDIITDIENSDIDKKDIEFTNEKIKKLYETIYLKENSKKK